MAYSSLLDESSCILEVSSNVLDRPCPLLLIQSLPVEPAHLQGEGGRRVTKEKKVVRRRARSELREREGVREGGGRDSREHDRRGGERESRDGSR